MLPFYYPDICFLFFSFLGNFHPLPFNYYRIYCASSRTCFNSYSLQLFFRILDKATFFILIIDNDFFKTLFSVSLFYFLKFFSCMRSFTVWMISSARFPEITRPISNLKLICCHALCWFIYSWGTDALLL